MANFTFPNESAEYRRERDALLDLEVALREQAEAVAARRRALPPGGAVPEDYRFSRETADGTVEARHLSALFGEHDSLLLYSMMFGPDWDAPCPSCTSIVDALDANSLAVGGTCAIAVVAAATPQQLRTWARRRSWRIDLVSGAGTGYLLDYAGFDGDDPAMVSAMNVFRRTADGIHHCWATELSRRPREDGHPRHVDSIWPLWNLLDMTPGGRGNAIVPNQDFEHAWFTANVLEGRDDWQGN